MASYSPIFSSQFIVYTDSTPNTSFEVPAGFTAVLRDFTASWTLAGTYSQVTIQNDEAAPACIVAQLEMSGLVGYDQWTGRIVVPAGGVINLVIGDAATGLSFYVGGYLLRNTLT